jgi:hypothetical protein
VGGGIGDTDGDGLPEVTIGTGAAGVDVTDSANLTVEGADTWSGTLHFFLCGPMRPVRATPVASRSVPERQ